jgi:hypothetical protein
MIRQLVWLFACFTLCSTPIWAGSKPQPAGSKKNAARRRTARPAPTAGVSETEQKLAWLTQKVAELTEQIAALKASSSGESEVRREIAELKARLQAAEERAAASEAAALRVGEARAEETAVASEKKIESPPPTLADTEAKVGKTMAQTSQVEEAVKRFGPFRFSGDFRLRADATWRSAFATPGPGQTALPHVQNIRARYRLRLNFDTELNSWLSFHGQLATGPVNNPLTMDQDFSSTVARHPFFINEALVDFHPTKWFSVQGGRLPDVFADNSRFLLDDDVRFNGFNERLTHTFTKPAAGFKSIEVRAGQYILSNPNVAIVTPGNLGPTGAIIGSTGRAAQVFRQGVLFNHQASEKASQQFGGDIQLFRNPNQIQFASTPAGLPIIVQGGLGLALSGPLTGAGNATTTSGGAIYTARNFQVARLTYRLDHQGFKSGNREYPVSFNLQVARNLGTGQRERDALLASIKLGTVRNRGDQSLLYVFGIKGANALISQLTDDDLGTGSGVNIRTHHLRYDIGLGKGIQLQSLLFIQNELRNSGQYPNFFVPLNAFTPRQYRIQEQIVFTF